MTLRALARLFGFVASFALLVSVAFAQMPDIRQMSGTPLPVADLSPGTLTVRVVRGQLSNPLEGQTVEVSGAGDVKTAKTDASGRATFTGLPPGARVKASAAVEAERLDSQEFQIPQAGGIRVMLVATDPAAPKTAAPAPAAPVAGTVAFGAESRFVIEKGDDALNVFNILQIVNAGAGPVQAEPLVFNLPDGAVGVGLLEGSSPTAVAAGTKVTVNGPFAPGPTLVQFAYSIPLGRDTITIAQALPAAMPNVSVVVQKIGANMQLASPQLAQKRDMQAEGNAYIVGQGGALRAGETLTLTLSGLPARPLWPRALTVTLAALILAGGAWAAARRPRPDAVASRNVLHDRREKLFAEVASLEAQRRKGTIDAQTYASRRESIVTALEDLYRGLDGEVA